ncbi:MAG: hypothetical protein II913_03230, partial [Elusimicrobiaceae bacterium]|nr:hypothetical protein [Elusimicrobiaceae bacterium]
MSQRTIIHNARVVTPAGMLEHAAVWIANGRIIQINNSSPVSGENWQLVDAQNKLLLPSWIDLHIHGMGGFGPEQETAQALLD